MKNKTILRMTGIVLDNAGRISEDSAYLHNYLPAFFMASYYTTVLSRQQNSYFVTNKLHLEIICDTGTTGWYTLNQ